MSIFNGDSIYKSGGGGGGAYTPGGTLVDDDFIRVENNTISDYENTTRDVLKFYIEPKDGEVINTVVELTNNTAATVVVYVMQNGLLLPLSYVGSNAVSAGEQYSISITGNTYTITQKVVPSQIPGAIEIGGELYGLIKYGNILWADRDLNLEIEGCITKAGYKYYTKEIIDNFNVPPFEIPNTSDWNDLRFNYGFNAYDLRSLQWGGTNLSGLNIRNTGIINSSLNIVSPNDCFLSNGITTGGGQLGSFYIFNSGGDGETNVYAYAMKIRPIIRV